MNKYIVFFGKAQSQQGWDSPETLEEFSAEYSKSFDEVYGQSEWVLLSNGEIPTDFSVDTYTIENGQLVKASAEVIAERKAAKESAEKQSVIENRKRAYAEECDPLLIAVNAYRELGEIEKADAMLVEWKQAREDVDKRYPYTK